MSAEAAAMATTKPAMTTESVTAESTVSVSTVVRVSVVVSTTEREAKSASTATSKTQTQTTEIRVSIVTIRITLSATVVTDYSGFCFIHQLMIRHRYDRIGVISLGDFSRLFTVDYTVDSDRSTIDVIEWIKKPRHNCQKTTVGTL